MSWLSGYVYRKKCSVVATVAGAQTNYQMELLVGESSGAAGEDIDCEGHCQDFPNDLRFTATDGEAEHDYWVDISSLEGTTPNRKVSVWIEVAVIPASGAVDFYMYYGKFLGTDGSDGEDTADFFADFGGVEHDYYKFDYVSITPNYVGAHQGVATDGTYFYTSGGVLTSEPPNLEIYKWDLSWNLISKRDTSADNPTGKTQINHIYVKDGILYIGANQVGNEATWITEYNTSDLTPITYRELGNHGRSEGCTFHDDYWWVTYSYKRYVSKFNTSWVHQADYNLSYIITPTNGYQGIVWIGDYIYCTIHDWVSPQAVDVYKWNGSGFDEVARLDLPEPHCTQGLCLDPDGKTMWFAARMSVVDAEHDKVVKTTINNLWGFSLDKWTVDEGAFGVVNSILTPTSAPAKCHLTSPPNTNPRRVIARMRDRSSPTSAVYYLSKFSSWSNMLATFLRDDLDQIRTKAYISGSGKTQRDTPVTINTNVWYIVETKLSGADIEVDVDGVNKQSFNDSDWNQSWTGLGWRTYTTAQDLDWIFIAKYASPEPTWGAWGSEEKREYLLLKLLQDKELNIDLSQKLRGLNMELSQGGKTN